MRLVEMPDLTNFGRGCIIEERRFGKPYSQSLVKLPTVYDKGFYRQITSVDSFKNREVKKFAEKFYMKNKPCPRYFSVRYMDDFLFEYESHLSLVEKYNISYEWESIELDRYDSIFDFYKGIKYDYKKQKYL